MSFPLPHTEHERLVTLGRLGQAAHRGGPGLDRIVAQAALAFDAPVALLSLVGAGRQWFAARVGTSLRGTAREVSFCTHALLGEGPLVVPDARADARFSRNPMVLGAPFVRYYAGAPVLCDGVALGALCVIDTAPRESTPETALAILRNLAAEALPLLRAAPGTDEPATSDRGFAAAEAPGSGLRRPAP